MFACTKCNINAAEVSSRYHSKTKRCITSLRRGMVWIFHPLRSSRKTKATCLHNTREHTMVISIPCHPNPERDCVYDSVWIKFAAHVHRRCSYMLHKRPIIHCDKQWNMIHLYYFCSFWFETIDLNQQSWCHTPYLIQCKWYLDSGVEQNK